MPGIMERHEKYKKGTIFRPTEYFLTSSYSLQSLLSSELVKPKGCTLVVIRNGKALETRGEGEGGAAVCQVVIPLADLH